MVDVDRPERAFSNWRALTRQRAEEQPDRVLYTFLHRGEREAAALSFRQLDEAARAVAAYLQTLTAVGDRALLLYPAGLDFIIAFYGCLYAGVIAVPAYPPKRNQNMTRLQAIIRDAEASVALTTASFVADVEKHLELYPELAGVQWLASETIASEAAAEWREQPLSEDALAFLQYTSGSTGIPKGVMVSHRNLLQNSAIIHRCFGHSTDSCGLVWLPPYHDMGLIGGVLQPLYGGFPVKLMSPGDFLQKPLRWLEAISRYRATTSGGPNFAYALACAKLGDRDCSDLDLSSWQVAFTGAEPVRADTLKQFAARFSCVGFRPQAFYPCYGMAETTLIATGGRLDALPVIRAVDPVALAQHQIVPVADNAPEARHLVGSGEAPADHQVWIVDPETGQPCPPGRVGEIWFSGPSVAQGYWNRPEASLTTFGARLADFGEVPFLRTGDLGFLENNELFVTGRCKDVLIIRGRNHYPQDIEWTVEHSHPALRPGCAAAFAVEARGSERLVVVQEVERSALRQLDVLATVRAIRQSVATEHELEAYVIVLVKPGSIPKTSSGKVRRFACRDNFFTCDLEGIDGWADELLNRVALQQLGLLPAAATTP